MKEEFIEICKDAADRGKLIELGWLSLHFVAIPEDAPAVHVDQMREAFFAGAQHLFASIINIFEPGAEITEKDRERITLIQVELDEFVRQLKAQNWPGNRVR